MLESFVLEQAFTIENVLDAAVENIQNASMEPLKSNLFCDPLPSMYMWKARSLGMALAEGGPNLQPVPGVARCCRSCRDNAVGVEFTSFASRWCV
jgi:hypothetical protein